MHAITAVQCFIVQSYTHSHKEKSVYMKGKAVYHYRTYKLSGTPIGVVSRTHATLRSTQYVPNNPTVSIVQPTSTSEPSNLQKKKNTQL